MFIERVTKVTKNTNNNASKHSARQAWENKCEDYGPAKDASLTSRVLRPAVRIPLPPKDTETHMTVILTMRLNRTRDRLENKQFEHTVRLKKSITSRSTRLSVRSPLSSKVSRHVYKTKHNSLNKHNGRQALENELEHMNRQKKNYLYQEYHGQTLGLHIP